MTGTEPEDVSVVTFFHRLNVAFERLADRLQGQDVERRNTVPNNRLGGDYAAVMKSHHGSRGSTPMGFGL